MSTVTRSRPKESGWSQERTQELLWLTEVQNKTTVGRKEKGLLMEALLIMFAVILSVFAYFWIGMFLGSFLLDEEDFEASAGFYWFTAWPVCLLLLTLTKLFSTPVRLLLSLFKKIQLPERFTVDPVKLGQRTRAYRTLRSEGE